MGTEISVDLAIVNAKAPLRALADVTLHWSDGAITIRRCAVFEKTGQPAWANVPQLPIEKNGKRSYAPLVDMQPDLKRRVLNAVLSEYLKKNGEG